MSKIKIEKAQLIPIMVVTGNHNLLSRKGVGLWLIIIPYLGRCCKCFLDLNSRNPSNRRNPNVMPTASVPGLISSPCSSAKLSGQDSLRGIEAGLASQATSLYHAGVRPVHRSTLAYANKHRSHELFEKIFATLIKLCLSLFNWAKFRTTKGAVKLHV